jgi:hypothetical protein
VTNPARRSSPPRRPHHKRRQRLSASLALFAWALLMGTPLACSSSAEDAFILRVESVPRNDQLAMDHWTYSLQTPVAARLEISFVDVRRAEEGVRVTLDVEANEPVAMDCFLPCAPKGWTERPRFAYDLKLTQGERSARASDLLPADMLPEVLVSRVPGPSSLPNGELTIPLDTPFVLAYWIMPSEPPRGDGGYGPWQIGPAGEPGGLFEVPETIDYDTVQPVADYPGALLQLRLRLTPSADE